MKERGFEILLMTVSAVGIIILFTILFGGPSFIFRKILEFVGPGF
ncbi:MAG: hypothetical protein UU21_C0001G0132 [Candidatus Levybacteria bacterium GW2011_GWA2_40_8]|nr:MAG: hypothetical protein UU21_C0001G0132 [Candidatus Levybacteria bacterium GW2011_GWA2_40_8]